MRRHSRVSWLRIAAGVLPAAAMVLSCGGPVGTAPHSGRTPNGSPPPAVAQAQQAGAMVDPAIVAADNAFGLNLLNSLIPDNAGNVAISPVSVALALQIVYNGAAGTTQQAMAQTLRLGSLSTGELNTANAALQASLINPDPKVQLTIANSLWMHLNDNPVSPSFTATDETYYGATLGDLSGAPDNVNAWVDSETQGLISQILRPQPAGYYQGVTAVLANAIYFKGEWSTAFDTALTASAPFTLSDGTDAQVQMMHQTGNYGYLRGAGFQAVGVPYGQGRLSMVIVLPDSGTAVDSLVSGITADRLSGWIGQLQSTYGSIALPRFTTTFGAALPGALTTLGMGIAFCPNAADFSGIAPLQCLADVEHKAIVEVNESGTVAAGATSVTIVTTVVQTPQFTVTMDRPFFYAIRDGKTGELLFIGIVKNPN